MDIIKELRATGSLDDRRLAQIIRRHNRDIDDNRRHYAKKKLLPYYLKVKKTDHARWLSWGVDPGIETQLLQLLKVKPQRTASGVATISVITKPWTCASDCLYCPNDLRMPKSYLSDEPACQRAERNYFDPYLQVSSRLRALTQMGHATDKIELIILGGTWSDYPPAYQIWFVSELFRALNDGEKAEASVNERRRFYRMQGLSNHPDELAAQVRGLQGKVDTGALSFNQAIGQLYQGRSGPWAGVAAMQVSDLDELNRRHAENEAAQHRVVGLVVETRPNAINAESLTFLRRLGCTKVQMGIQSLDPALLIQNNRTTSLQMIKDSMAMLRIFGFKIHVHFMVNLLGSTVLQDKLDYRDLVSQKPYLPDEVKLYPCVLVEGTGLYKEYQRGLWQPYDQEELLDVLRSDVLSTPPFIRISRMIRDISAKDIVAGNKMANIRQLVERGIEEGGGHIQEVRYREIRTDTADVSALLLEALEYETTASDECFLQWVTPQGRIAGFLRLSFPKAAYLRGHKGLPVAPDEAMIREVHVYGQAAQLHKTVAGAQHQGLGRQLVQRACELAKEKGYTKVNVISSVGTRAYYRNLGFEDGELYQQLSLE